MASNTGISKICGYYGVYCLYSWTERQLLQMENEIFVQKVKSLAAGGIIVLDNMTVLWINGVIYWFQPKLLLLCIQQNSFQDGKRNLELTSHNIRCTRPNPQCGGGIWTFPWVRGNQHWLRHGPKDIACQFAQLQGRN